MNQLEQARQCFSSTPVTGQKDMKVLILRLMIALDHCHRRLNDIPHRYEDTNFQFIRESLEQGNAFIEAENKKVKL